MNGSIEAGTRRSLLERAAVTAGEAWARGWLEELRSEGRVAAGGWPGTVSQARSRVRACVAEELARARLDVATATELESAARAAYAHARDVWRAFAQSEDVDDPTEEQATT